MLFEFFHLGHVDATQVLQRNGKDQALGVCRVRHDHLLQGFENLQRQAFFQHHQEHALAAVVGQAEERFLGSVADAAAGHHGNAAGAEFAGCINAVLFQVFRDNCYQCRELHWVSFLRSERYWDTMA